MLSSVYYLFIFKSTFRQKGATNEFQVITKLLGAEKKPIDIQLRAQKSILPKIVVNYETVSQPSQIYN